MRAFYDFPEKYWRLPELARCTELAEETLLERFHILRKAGFEIEENSTLGYLLRGQPARLIGDDILAHLSPQSWVREIIVFEETRSTNDIVNRLGREGAAEGIVVFAEHQTAGRGRFGRKWESERGNGIWFSLLVRPSLPPEHWTRLTMATALAVVDGIKKVTGLQAGIKWPNDLEINKRKVSGILVESRGFQCVGIGVNVNQTQFPPEISDRAGSLKLALGQTINRSELAAAILNAFEGRYAEAETRHDHMMEEYRAHSLLLGQYIRVSRADGAVLCGVAEEIDQEGRLGLRNSDGLLWLSDGEASVVSQREDLSDRLP